MGEIAGLPDRQKLQDNFEFIKDLARFSEGLTDETAIRKKYRLSEDIWNALGEDDDFVRSVTDEKTRRIRDGSHKREKAQLLVVKAPDVVSKILLDDGANPKHRLDAAKVLDDFATPAQEGVALSDRFSIVINLGADSDGKPIIERYDKSIAVDVNDGSAALPRQEPLATIPANRPKRQANNQSTGRIKQTAEDLLIWGPDDG